MTREDELTPIQTLKCSIALFVAAYMNTLGDIKVRAAIEETLMIVPPDPPRSTRISSNAFKTDDTVAV